MGSRFFEVLMVEPGVINNMMCIPLKCKTADPPKLELDALASDKTSSLPGKLFSFIAESPNEGL